MAVRACLSRREAARKTGKTRLAVGITRFTYRCWAAPGIALALACWLTMAAGRAEQADSGWTVGRPSISAMGSAEPDPAARVAIDHVLEQTRVPLLRTPSPTAKAFSARVAQKTAGVDGWRPAQETPVPAMPSVAAAPGPSVTSQSARQRQGTAKVEEPSRPSRDAQNVPPAVSETDADDPADGAVEFRAPKVDALPTIQFGGPRPFAPAASEADADEPSQPRAVLSKIEPAPAPSADIRDAADFLGVPEAWDPAEITIIDEMEAQSGRSDAEAPTRVESGATHSAAPKSTAPPASNSVAPETDDDDARDRPDSQTEALPPLTRQLMNLRTKVRSVLKGYSRKSLNSREHDPWEVMHGMLAYELHSKIHQGSPRGPLITSVGWLCYNKPCKNLTLLYVSPEGELRAKQGVGLQGHKGQLLAMLAQCRVSPDYPIRVGSYHFTIHDLIEAEKKTCYPKTELTFKLIAFSHYLDLDERWVNDAGLEWDIPRLIREEIAQPIRGAACGGTHRLSGLTLAVKARERRGEPIDGEYLRAADYVEKYENYAFRLQNRDGSLSTRWFQGRGDEDDDDRRVKTTGHILEWLVYSLSDEELREQRTIRAVNYLASLLYSNYDHDWEVGPRSHAIHALLRYDERVFRPYDGMENVAASRSNQPSARRTGRSSWR